MGRPRAGHGWTAFRRNGRLIKLICDCHGLWVTTGEAQKWPRCRRFRKPENMMPEDSGLCVHCFYYKSGKGSDWFWSRSQDYLFPYNIGSRAMAHIWDRAPLEDSKVDWRQYLRSQMAGQH